MDEFFVETGLRYWRGELGTAPIGRPFRPSLREDVADACGFSAEQARRYGRLGARSAAAGEGVFSMLVAGASSRMNPADAPADVRALLGGHPVLSKAAVPAGVAADGRAPSYLEEFARNISRLLHALGAGARNEILLLSNDEYRAEHDAVLSQNGFFGLDPKSVRFIHQRLGPKFVATPSDVEKSRAVLGSEERFRAAMQISKDAQARIGRGDRNAVILPGERDPLGHGEYFHELVASGELSRWFDAGKKWVFLKNVDNLAAKLDRFWLATLGRFLEEKIDFQPELSPRAPGRKGGSLIIRTDDGSPQLAEDPNIESTNAARKRRGEPPVMETTASYWFNDAVAIFSPRYVAALYKEEDQPEADFVRELAKASVSGRAAIADRGRKRFPVILDAKPAKKSPAMAVKCETNLWQSTELVGPGIKVSPIGVRGSMNLDVAHYHKLDEQGRFEELEKLRFLSTKNWDKSEEEKKKAREGLEKILGRKVSDEELGLSLETYEGNKTLVTDLLAYNRKVELV